LKISLFIYLFISSVFSNEKQLYSTVQMMDQVMVIDLSTLQVIESVSTEFGNSEEVQDCMEYTMEVECNMTSGCEWMMEMCMESMNSNVMNTPHFVVLDETSGYWFVTTIASGFVAQYSLLDNSFIDAYFVGDSPALLAVDTIHKIIYCSRMMPMNGMGNMMPSGESNIIQALYYSPLGLSEVEGGEYEINSPAPHGITINNDGTELYTTSNTADWLYKIHTGTGEIQGVALDSQVGNAPDQTTQRLKPIQCLYKNNKLFITCSAGVWYNPYTGQETVIPGQVQMWNANTMELLDSIELGDYTAPWHIKDSPIEDVLYVALNGDNLYETEGLACISYENNLLSLEWITNDSDFDSLHGIDVSSDGSRIYVSGRGDGNIHVFDESGEYIDNLFLGSMTMLGGIAVEKKGLPELGDLNNDTAFNIFDIVICVESVLSLIINDPYIYYAGDIYQDSIINISDILLIVDLIMSS
jgi:DNA-binding beta-propeller fold protein YncE